MRYMFHQYQLALILFNSNLCLKELKNDSTLTVRDKYPDQRGRGKVVSFYTKSNNKSLFIKSEILCTLRTDYKSGTGKVYCIMKGEVKDILKQSENTIINSVKNNTLNLLDRLVEAYALASRVEKDDVRWYIRTDTESSLLERIKYLSRCAEIYDETLQFITSLFWQPFGDVLQSYLENTSDNRVALRYLTADERGGIDDKNNPWMAIRYITTSSNISYITPWSSKKDKYDRLADVYRFMSNSSKEDLDILEDLYLDIKNFCRKEKIELDLYKF